MGTFALVNLFLYTFHSHHYAPFYALVAQNSRPCSFFLRQGQCLVSTFPFNLSHFFRGMQYAYMQSF